MVSARKIGCIILATMMVILVTSVATIIIIKDEPLTPTVSRALSLSEGLDTELATIIQMNRYDCPLAKQAYKRGKDAYGDVIKVYCGPKTQDGIYKNAVFRVTFTPMYDKTNLLIDLRVVPWTSEMSDYDW